ncbi:plasmid encoded RepA protein, partial [Bifidobacterium pseudolongum subsp. globosum]
MPHANKDDTPSTEISIQPTLLEDLEARTPEPAEIWYAHSILTTTLYPPPPPPPRTHYLIQTTANPQYPLQSSPFLFHISDPT